MVQISELAAFGTMFLVILFIILFNVFCVFKFGINTSEACQYQTTRYRMRFKKWNEVLFRCRCWPRGTRIKLIKSRRINIHPRANRKSPRAAYSQVCVLRIVCSPTYAPNKPPTAEEERSETGGVESLFYLLSCLFASRTAERIAVHDSLCTSTDLFFCVVVWK